MKSFFYRVGICGMLYLGAVVCAHAEKAMPERFYQKIFAEHSTEIARMEVVAGDGTRCDILTGTHAIEVDFARKWAESLGQSLNYALQFERRGGILLILKSDKDGKYLKRLLAIVAENRLPIDIWTIQAGKILGANPSVAKVSLGTTDTVTLPGN